MRVVSYRGVEFMPSDVACVILELSPYGISASISKVTCHAYGLFLFETSCALEGLGDWLQARFTDWESVAYLKTPI